MEKPGILILTPDLKVQGGVSNFFEALNLSQYSGISYFYVSFDRKENSLQAAWRIVSNYLRFIYILLVRDISLVHINPSFNSKSFFRDGIFCFLAHILRVKTLVFFHGWDDAYEERVGNSSFLQSFFKMSFGSSDDIIVLSKIFKQKLIRLNFEKRIRFHSMTTVADSSFLSQFSIDNKIGSFGREKTLLFLSRIEDSKGIFIALEAFRRLEKQYPDLKLIVAGDGNALERSKQFVIDKQIQKVEFTGYVRGVEKGKILLRSHILLFPTYYGEGMPTNVLEAMLYGMPVVSRNNAGVSDTVAQNVNGFLTQSKDPEVFYGFLKTLLDDYNLYQRMARENHQKAMAEYSSDRVREKIFSVYQMILDKPLNYARLLG